MRERQKLLTRNDYRLALLALLLYAAGRAPFLGQWDSFDYLKQVVTHRLSDLGFGRPVFIAYNIALWEGASWLFRLTPTQVEDVMMATAVALGAAGVLLFARLARQMLPAEAARMAVVGFALSPLYAVYAGYIMTEVPMLAAALACAGLLWPDRREGRIVREVAAGVLFGLAIGIREQALTLAPAFAWILWVHRRPGERFASLARYSLCAALVAVAPVLALYLHDPVAFVARMHVWLRAIPMGQAHFDRNVQASLLFTFAMAPGIWLGLSVAASSLFAGRGKTRAAAEASSRSEHSLSRRAVVSGVLLCLVLPLVALWRDADVQLHPRYSLIILPAAAIACASAFHARWRTRRTALIWGVLQVVVFGVAQVAVMPFRELQTNKMEFARSVREALPGRGLIAAGSYSPVLDYYRAVGERPDWQILWSGWGWTGEAAEKIVRNAWLQDEPVYLCDGPLGWAYFEDERLDLFYVFRRHRSERVAPGITRISPLETQAHEAGILANTQ